MSQVGYGIVGAGYFGAALARALAKMPRAHVTAVYDPRNAARLAEELGAPHAESVEQLCSMAGVDAVVVASPNWAHAEPVIAAARNGKHIFCEKPIALSYADCLQMVEAARSAGVIFMAGHVMNFMDGVRRAKSLVAEGTLGDLLFCRAVRNGWEEPQPKVTWKKKRELSGGHLYHHIHELDLVLSIMGPALKVTMAGGNVAHQGPAFGDEDDLLLLTLEFAGNRFATLEYGSAFRWPEHHVLIEGTKGAIRIDLQDVGVELRAPGRHERFLLHRTPEEDADRTAIYRNSTMDGAIMYGNPSLEPPLWLRGVIDHELAYFHGLMQGDAPLPEFATLTDGSAAMAAIATADALSRSLAEDRKVLVSEVIDPQGGPQGRRQS
jgi:predicted dehydrogenase